MKTFTVAAAMLALIALPAHAQVGGKRHQGDAKKTEQKRPEVDEKAARIAVLKQEWKAADPDRRKVIEAEVAALTGGVA